MRWSAPDSKKAVFTVRSSGDEYTVIIRGIAYLILKAGAGLRLCKECQTPFIAVKRQEYCTTTCSQTFRDRKKQARRTGKTPRGRS